ncbi:hypothetical protein BXY66_3578 [Shimia isoporae]|uniref:Uncharacterized protein n=1 Tax=Shimia isoporae TaxID=647720 RepID=A0A4R1N9R3_9RHOB|nr:hypothetical protein [Shimia isoporae]TCK99874.1 hypothetical protein BXY66_3578 [Shimia isoporae]
MKINLSPQERPDRLELCRQGDVLLFNGEATDLRDLVGKEEIEHPWIAGPVREVGGSLCVTVILPHGPDAPLDTRYPSAIELTEDGNVPLPAFSR